MRYLLVVLFAVSLLGCAGPQQTAGINDAAAPAEAQVIEIQYDGTPQQAYKRAAQVLQSEGFTLQNTDSDLRSISTDRKEVDGIMQSYAVRLNANVTEDAVVQLRGWYELEDLGEERISKYGSSGSSHRKAWRQMFQVAEGIGDTMSFQK